MTNLIQSRYGPHCKMIQGRSSGGTKKEDKGIKIINCVYMDNFRFVGLRNSYILACLPFLS